MERFELSCTGQRGLLATTWWLNDECDAHRYDLDGEAPGDVTVAPSAAEVTKENNPAFTRTLILTAKFKLKMGLWR